MTQTLCDESPACSRHSLSAAARERMLAFPGEPFLFSGWKDVVFIHLEADAKILQREVPFQLDLHEGKAYVSLVAFHLENMCPRFGGKFAALLMKPFATHELLNIRTYISHQNETGIYFLAEYLPDEFSVHLGPLLYGLPYRLGKLDYHHQQGNQELFGNISDCKSILNYRIELPELNFHPSELETLDEFLLERYIAFTFRNGIRRRFSIWHPPWHQMRVNAELGETNLLSMTGKWFQNSRMIAAHYSPGFEKVWMGRPKRLQRQPREIF